MTTKQFSGSVGQYLGHLWSDRLNGYSDEAQAHKSDAHRVAKDLLTNFAKDYLGLPKTAFEVRSNQAGPAVSGEVTLHTDVLPGQKYGIYVQIGQSCLGDDNIMYRIVKSLKDYTGGANNWTSVRSVFNSDTSLKNFAATVQRLTGDHL